MLNALNGNMIQFNFIKSEPEFYGILINYLSNNNPDSEWMPWAVNFIAQNPDVTAEEFENWFLGENEGSDGEYINPNLLKYETPIQRSSLPSFSAWFNNFPKIVENGIIYPMNAGDVYKSIGGSIFNSYKNSANYQNACAVRRGSKALLYSGISIPVLKYGNPPKQVTQKGADGKNYILAAASFNKFMIDKFGDTPDKLEGSDANNPRKIAKFLNGKTGIYVIVNHDPNIAGCTGHVVDAIINGKGISGLYLTPKGGVKSIRIWILN